MKELLAAGYDEEQILVYFERSYGEFVRLRPPLRGVNWLVWLAPVAGLLAGGAAVRWALRSSRGGGKAKDATGGGLRPELDALVSDAPGPDTLPEDERLAVHVRRVRELAYGWPNGLSPAARERAASTTHRS